MAPRRRKPPPQSKKDKTTPISKQDGPEDCRLYLKVYAPLFGIFLFSCLCTGGIWYCFIRDKLPLEYVRTNAVEILMLPSSEKNFVEEIAKRKKPVIVRNSFITNWPAFKKWTPQYLQEKKNNFLGVYENDNKWFGPYYDSSKPMAEITERLNKYRTDLNLSSEDFVQRINNPSSGRFTYFTGDIDQLGEWAVKDITPFDELLRPNPTHSSINAWIGQPGVIAHCHYDGYHNFYAQLYGRKRFTLFSPSSYAGLYPYPFLHPSHAQAQVNLSNYEDVKLFPLVKTLESFEALLYPGDLLYIPPLWFHHVEAIDVSISVNVWTDTRQSQVMEEVFNIQLPINEVKWNGEHLKAIGSSVILFRMVNAVCSKMKCSSSTDDPGISAEVSLINRLWSSRFQMLMKKEVLSNSFKPLRNAHRRSLLCENDHLPNLFYQGIQQKLDRTSLSSFTSRITKLVSQLPRDTWETWFGNYIEYVAYNAVALKDIGLFLKHFNSCIGHFQ